jgi:hypothetical protein
MVTHVWNDESIGKYTQILGIDGIFNNLRISEN